MLEDVVGFLRCPHCHAELELRERVLRCAGGHAFDVARHGYVSLLAGDARAIGDSAAMVAARERFLGAGHYEPLAQALAEEARGGRAQAAGSVGGSWRGQEHAQGCVLDIGAGTGAYLARVLDALAGRVGVAADVSKYALRRAARAHPRIGAVACDVWRGLPLRDGVAELALCVFAPRNGPEIARVLAHGGRLAVVTPTPRHLAELVSTLDLLRVDERKRARLDEQLPLELVERRQLEWTLELSGDEVRDAVAMGPSAWHVDPGAIDVGPLATTASVELSVYRR